MKPIITGLFLVLSFITFPDNSVAKEPSEPSIKQLAKSCKTDGSACTAAAKSLFADSSNAKSFVQGVELATIGCNQHKNAEACIIGGKALIATGIKENISKGVVLSNKACTNNALDNCVEANRIFLDANKSQTSLSFWYGSGSSGHDGLVYRPLKQMCANGMAAACKANGDMWLLKNKVNDGGALQTNMLAIQAYRGACDSDDAESCSQLVELYGQNIPKQRVVADIETAKAFAVKACKLGQSQHCSPGGVATAAAGSDTIDPSLSYQEQMLVAELALRDGKTKMALDALERMASENRDEANYRLGILHLTGEAGVSKNRSRAYLYLEKSGYPESALLRANLAIQDNDAAAYNTYMNKAYWAGSKEAESWWQNKQRAYLDAAEASSKRMIADAKENKRSNDAYEAELIKRAMNNYYLPQDREPVVCGLFREGGGLVKKCLTREYYTKKYVR